MVMFARSVDGQAQDAQQLLSLDSFLPVGTKKAAKVYTVASHPLRPDVIAVGANTGRPWLVTSRVSHQALCSSGNAPFSVLLSD